MLEAKKIVGLIATIGKASVKLTTQIHEANCNIVGHALQHGDVTLADKLIEAVGNGTRRQAIVAWLEVFGPFRFNAKEGKFSLHKAKRAEFGDRGANAVVEELLVGVTWADYTKEAVKSTYDVVKQLRGILAAAASKQQKGETVVNAGITDDVRSILLKFELASLERQREEQPAATMAGAASGLKIAA